MYQEAYELYNELLDSTDPVSAAILFRFEGY